jgi:3-oxoadipate enol-lactonase
VRMANANRVRLAYQIDGAQDAPAIVMINSLGTNMGMWDEQAGPFSQSFRVVRYDCRGHGASDVLPGPYTIELLGRDLLSLLDNLAIEQAHLCGLSLGGVVAQWFAASYPERVKRVILANTAARIGTRESWTTRIETVQAGGMAAIHDAVLARFLSEGFRIAHADVTERIGTMLMETRSEGYIAACEALRDADLHAMLASITTPSLIIGSELDESTPVAQAYELRDAIAGSQLAILPQVAHLSNVEQPEVFNRLVLRFLG